MCGVTPWPRPVLCIKMYHSPLVDTGVFGVLVYREDGLVDRYHPESTHKSDADCK